MKERMGQGGGKREKREDKKRREKWTKEEKTKEEKKDKICEAKVFNPLDNSQRQTVIPTKQ